MLYGAVSGRVTCVDTNGPARLTEVTLQTINVKPAAAEGAKYEPSAALHTYQTALDGTFIIPKVQTGTYYVVIKKAGYLSPITQFTRAELAKPTPELLARIVKVVPTVTVESGRSSNLEVRLERGAIMAGAIHYDDGTPVSSAPVVVLNKERQDGKDNWAPNYEVARTDDQGRYRITNLASGEYLVKVTLEINEKFVDTVLGPVSGSSSSPKYALDFFAGTTAHESEGKPMKLLLGEERDDGDITVPVSRLHSVTGTITEIRSGHPVNSGKLSLSFADGKQLASADVDASDGLFHFEFVPEGEYTLTVTEAKDVSRQEIAHPAGWWPPSYTKEATLREYGTSTQSLIVKNDMTGVVVQVPGKPTR